MGIPGNALLNCFGLVFTKGILEARIDTFLGRLAQWLERLLHTQEVSGSNPLLPISFSNRHPNWTEVNSVGQVTFRYCMQLESPDSQGSSLP
jgi:hypothetical protein